MSLEKIKLFFNQMKADVDNRELVYNQGADDHTLQEEKESQDQT